jgi:putative Holliday junction resolvase
VRVLGVDYGDRRIGVALSDPSGTFARPFEVVAGEKEFLERLGPWIESEEIGLVVLGLPLNMDGSHGPKSEQVQGFKERLVARHGVEVRLWDERLTTAEADRYLRLSGLSAQKRRQRIDKVAAQVLLQSYLDWAAASHGDREAPPAPAE